VGGCKEANPASHFISWVFELAAEMTDVPLLKQVGKHGYATNGIGNSSCSRSCCAEPPLASCSNAPEASMHVVMSLGKLREATSLNIQQHKTCRSHGYVLNDSGNLLLQIQVAELQKYSWVNLNASIAALIFIAVESTLLILHSLRVRNFFNHGNLDVWEVVFHRMEFWSTALFNIVIGVVLLNSTSDSFHELTQKWPTLIKRLALLNIVTAFVAALLVSIDLPYFEVLSHRIEYVITLCMILIDYVLWLGLTSSNDIKINPFQLVCLVLSVGVGISMNVLYNALPAPYNEVYSHFVEFPTEIIAGSVIFYSAVESKRKADLEIFRLMYSECMDSHSPHSML
jgi:hypothetical protein